MKENITITNDRYHIPFVHFDLGASIPSGHFYQEIEALTRREYLGKRLPLTVGGKDSVYIVVNVEVRMSGVSLIVTPEGQ